MITTSLGGNLSVQFPISAWVRTFNHFWSWWMYIQAIPDARGTVVWPNHATCVVPKDGGMGLMISAFQSRVFSFGLDLTKDDLAKVNQKRAGRYCDKETAIDTRKSATKAALTTSPFICEYEYGANLDLSTHSPTSKKRCIPNILSSSFLITRADMISREYRLNVEQMTKFYGGPQRKMHETVLKLQQGYLGPHSPKLQVGDIQSMVFKSDDVGPSWMEASEQVESAMTVHYVERYKVI